MASEVQYSNAYFQEWRDSCRVRRIQEAYSDLVAKAKANGTSPDEEMKASGCKEQADFFRNCPRFDLFCWPSELGELGSGVVLYFHFLAFLICFLLLALLLMAYPMAYYGSEGKLDSWNWSPGGFTNEDTDRCKCRGGALNDGFGLLGAAAGADYGSSCAAWDIDTCLFLTTPGDGLSQDLGAWCCRSWCWADDDCVQTQSGSASNVKVVSGGATLIRSYSACEDSVDQLAQCSTSLLSGDVRYPGSPYDQDNCMTEIFFVDATPGNVGPDNGTEEAVLVMHVVVLIMLCLAIVLKVHYQERVEVQVDTRTTQPNDYAVLVSGLPPSATDEAQIAEWFQNNGVEGMQLEIVKVVIGWDATEYREKMAKLKDITARLKETDPTEQAEEFKRLEAEAAEIRKDFMSSAPTIAARLTSSGFAVLLFRLQEDQRRCVERWDTIWGRWFHREAGGCGGLLPGPPLPLFPLGSTPVCKIRLKRAPNPQDINWEDLGVPSGQKAVRLVKTNAAMALLIVLCFGVCYLVKWLSRGSGGACHSEAIISGSAASILPALAIAYSNAAVSIAAKRFGVYEYHDTKGEEVVSQALKMALAMMVNTSGVLLFVNAQPKEWYAAGGLLDDLLSLLLMVGCARPLVLLLDIPYYLKALLRVCRRKNLTQKKLDYWNEVEERGKPKTKEEAKELQQVRKQVEFFKKALGPSEMLMTRRYAYAVNIFMCALFYMPVMPLIPVLAILSLCIQFAVDKYLIVRWFKRPPVHDAAEAKGSVHFIRFLGCIFFPVAVLYFLSPSWEDKDATWRWFVPSLLAGVGFCVVPLQVTRAVLGLKCLLPSKRGILVQDSSPGQDYYEAQHMWSKENKYHLSHFLYKGLPPSVNPEYLSPGKSSAISMAAVKDSCAASAAKGADAVLGPAGEDVDPASPGGGGAASPTPVTYGAAAVSADVVPSTVPPPPAAAAPADVEPVSVGSSLGGDPPPAMADPPASLVAASGGAGSPKTPKTKTAGMDAHPVWEYEGKHDNFTKYAVDCHDYIERRYQEFKETGGRPRVKVTTAGMTLSVDFQRMTQVVLVDDKPNGRLRKVRRREEC